jgi:DNA-3-methyladenine glycosylase
MRGAKRLGLAFYQRGAGALARAMLGTVIVRVRGGERYRARIVETEAYVGTHDLACHASKGRTGRTEVMFGRAGVAYVYLIYGMHQMFNVVCGAVGDAQAVLVRAAEPLDGWEANLSGPGRFARGMGITRDENGLDLTTSTELYLTAARRPVQSLGQSRRVGVDYAGAWRDELLRFYDAESAAVSQVKT